MFAYIYIYMEKFCEGFSLLGLIIVCEFYQKKILDAFLLSCVHMQTHIYSVVYLWSLLMCLLSDSYRPVRNALL